MFHVHGFSHYVLLKTQRSHSRMKEGKEQNECSEIFWEEKEPKENLGFWFTVDLPSASQRLWILVGFLLFFFSHCMLANFFLNTLF